MYGLSCRSRVCTNPPALTLLLEIFKVPPTLQVPGKGNGGVPPGQAKKCGEQGGQKQGKQEDKGAKQEDKQQGKGGS